MRNHAPITTPSTLRALAALGALLACLAAPLRAEDAPAAPAAAAPAASAAPAGQPAPVEEAAPAAAPADAPATDSPYSATDQSSPYLAVPAAPAAPAAAGGKAVSNPNAKRGKLGDWEFEINPQAWMPTLSGEVVTNKVQTDLEPSFIDTIEDPEFPLSISVGASRDKLSFFFNYLSMDLSTENEDLDVSLGSRKNDVIDPLRKQLNKDILDPVTLALLDDIGLDVDTDASIDVNMMLAEFGVGYRLWESSEDVEGGTLEHTFDVVGGVRYWRVESKLDIDVEGGYDPEQLAAANLSTYATRTGQRSVIYKAEESWIDPVIGGRFKTDLSPDTALVLAGDVGGFGIGSDLTWKASGVISHRPNKAFELYGGYQALKVKYNADDNNDDDHKHKEHNEDFSLNTLLHGPVVGFKMIF